jgi:hypothetical protein
MRPISRVRRAVGRLHIAIPLAWTVLLASERLRAQAPATGLTRTLAAIASTPLGALTPVGPAMATSRDEALLFGFRVQYGSRELPEQRSLTSYGLAATAQVRGGALISATVGSQRGDSDICAESSCDTHRVMAGLRYSSNFVTTRPFLQVPFFTENDATGTAALELGVGWADRGFGERQHWTADVTVPLSIAVGQRMRVVPFATPSFAVAWGTTERKWSRGQRILIGGGVTAQEVGQWFGVTGLDVTLALQRAFSPHGSTLGATVSWMHVP